MSTETNHTVGKLLARIDRLSVKLQIVERENKAMEEANARQTILLIEKDGRIAELETQLSSLKEVQEQLADLVRNKDQRIAELEAHDGAVLPLYERIEELERLLPEAWNLGFIAPMELDEEHVPKYRRDDIKALLEKDKK